MSIKLSRKGPFDFSGITNKTVFLALLLITFFIRFPFFFRDYIDRDESTFILLGQSWADGFLPYTQLWDLKPPLTFAFFAVLISIFGKSFLAIRFTGVILVVITAFFTYKLGTLITIKRVSFFSAICCIALLSLFGSLQGVMSEHICMAFFMPALYFISKKNSAIWFLFAGILMGISVMVKLNMAYPILLVGLFLMYQGFHKGYQLSLFNVVPFALGIVLVILGTAFPYFYIDQLSVWWDSVILAPLKYTEARRYSLLKLAPFFTIVGCFLAYAWHTKKLNFKHPPIQLLIIAIIGVLFSFLKGGRINGHYLIQLHPMLLLLVAVVIHTISQTIHLKIPKYAAVILLLIPTESYLEYINIIQNKHDRNTFYNGEGFSVPKYISDNGLETKNIMFFEYHIGYWNLGMLPPTIAATHPSNICRDELYRFYDNPRKNSMEELKFIMEDLRPRTVVIRKGKRIFDKKEVEENTYIDAYLAKNYQLLETVENAGILQRLE